MSEYSVLVVDDEPKQLAKVQSLVQQGLHSMSAHLGLLPDDTFVVVTSDEAGLVADTIRDDLVFPHNIIVADIFMPWEKGDTPIPGGGAKRIYRAIKESGRDDEILLVVMSNRDSEAKLYFDEIWKEQSRLAYPWAINYVKPELLRGRNNDEKLFEKNQWVYAVCRAIAKSKDRRWRETFLKSTMFDILGFDPTFMEAKVTAEQFADEKIIMLTGETGSGKELIAEAIHNNSSRSERNFVKLNCNAIPETLLDSELFGYERNAFTGAATRKLGVFESSDHGTVFLDEFGADIAQLRLLDTKLRRLLSAGQYARLGGTTTQSFRGTLVLGSSNLTDLRIPDEISRDLYERIKTFQVALPPLRNRRADIIPLAERFLERFAKGDLVKVLSPEAKEALQNYDWPGNVREVENCIELLADTIMTQTIDEIDIAKILKITTVAQLPASRRMAPSDITPDRMLTVLRSPEVKGNRTKAAQLLFPDCSPKQIKAWGRKKIDPLVREFIAADPGFAEQLPAAYHERAVGGRPRTRAK